MSSNVLAPGEPTKVCKLDIGGGNVVRAAIHEDEENVTLIAAGTFRGGRGRGRAFIELDRQSFYEAVRIAEERGLTALRLSELAQRVFGHTPIFTIQERPLLPR